MFKLLKYTHSQLLNDDIDQVEDYYLLVVGRGKGIQQEQALNTAIEQLETDRKHRLNI